MDARLKEIRLHVVCAAPTIPAPIPKKNRMIATRVQRGEYISIEGARHLPNVEDPGRFNRVVIDWCDRQRR